MFDIWIIVQWWDDWQLRVLVLGSLSLQWFLLLAAPMRKYSVPYCFRMCIWLAYISSDALAIYALATLFNRHARTVPASYCPAPAPAGKEQSRILEVLWAPILLINLGGQKEMTAYEIEDNELWTRHTVTLVSQVSVALYAFYKSWHPSSSDRKLTAAAVLLFVIGVVSFSEKPVALNKAKIKQLADLSAWIQGTKQRSVWREDLIHFSLFEESNLFTVVPRRLWTVCCGHNRREKEVALPPEDKVLMVLSDMSLLAAAKELVERGKAEKLEDVLPPLVLVAEKGLKQWLRGAFAFIYTRASVVVTRPYLIYHLALVPVLHVGALVLFATSDKRRYKRADVKITYIILCLTAALDFLAVFVRLLVYRLMSMTSVSALCETLPGYNLIDESVREADQGSCARYISSWCRRRPDGELYKKVEPHLLADLVEGSQDRDLASYRIFDSTTENWALSKELQDKCGKEIKDSLQGISFDRSVLIWHIATDLCFRCSDVVDYGQEEVEDGGGAEGPEEEEGGGGVGGAGQGTEDNYAVRALRLQINCTEAISNYMVHLLNSNPEMLLTGSRNHILSEAREGLKSIILSDKAITEELAPESEGCTCTCRRCCASIGRWCSCASTGCSCSCGQLNRAHHFSQKDLLRNLVSETASREVDRGKNSQTFYVIKACKLANELLAIPENADRWKVMYRVWMGMLCYSASMCRGYLHAKSLGEGGEFLSFVWLVLSLKGAKTLADKLQMPPETTKPHTLDR